jgi:hypothetical protein
MFPLFSAILLTTFHRNSITKILRANYGIVSPVKSDLCDTPGTSRSSRYCVVNRKNERKGQQTCKDLFSCVSRFVNDP